MKEIPKILIFSSLFIGIFGISFLGLIFLDPSIQFTDYKPAWWALIISAGLNALFFAAYFKYTKAFSRKNFYTNRSSSFKEFLSDLEILEKHAREITCIMAPDERILFVSPGIEAVLGYTSEEVIGKKLFELGAIDSFEKQENGVADPECYHFQFRKKNGQEIWMEASLYYERDENNEPVKLLAYVSEITALKKQSQVLEQMQHLANIGSWEYSLENGSFYVTDQVARIFDVEKKKQEFNFESLLQYFDRESQNLMKREFQQALEYEKSWDLELSFKDRRGKRKWLRTVGSPYTRNGKVIKLAGTLQDITEHIAFEELIIKKQNELKAFVENTPVSVAMFDKDMCYIAASYCWCESFQINQDNLKGKCCYDTIPNMSEEWREAHQRSLNGEVIHQEEDTFRNQNGTIEWVKWEARPWYNENGQIGGIVIFVENISHQKKQAELSRKQQKRMEEIYRIASDNSGNFNAQLHQMLRIATWALNMEHGVFFQIKEEQAYIVDAYSINDLYKTDETYVLNDVYAFITYQLDKLLAIPHFNQSAFCAFPCYKAFKMEAYISVPIWVRGERFGTLDFMASSPLSEDFQQADKDFVQLLGQWISSAFERQQYEQELIISKEKAEEASKAKEQFLSIMSHEIRTPMNAVVGISHLLLQEYPKPEQVESLHTLQFSANNLLALINDILDFSKIEAGKIELESVEFNLKDLLQKLRHLMQPAAREKGIDLLIQIDATVQEHIKGDSTRLNQILTNLLSNAIKFTHKGHVALKVSTKQITNRQVYIRFDVEDTGIGIPKDKQSLIFESFSQASSDTTRKYGGTGLGLAITKKLVALQKGCIQISSELDRGTTFSVELPFLHPENKEITSVQKTNGPSISSLNGVHVLLVEDQEINQFVAKRFLEKWGVTYDLANNGLEGLEKAQSKAYDVILMDLQMPEMDGYESSRKIRELDDPYFKEVPILALTAAALSGVRQSVLQAGMNDHISKPFDPTELYEKLQKFSSHTEDKLVY